LQNLYRAITARAGASSPDNEPEFRRVLAAIKSYERWSSEEFQAAHDHFRLLGEDNFRRYLPVEPLRIRIHADDALSEIFCRAAAARGAGCRAIISAPPTLAGKAADSVALLDQLTGSWAGAIEFIEEDDAALADAIRTGIVARVRYAAADRVPEVIRLAASGALQYIADAAVSLHGRIELLWYMREQSVSHVYHRYGNLGLRANEQRDEPV
jgi:RHH-type proline utilization regulon transcriptional repressor/proline dehydrogenase/delta 1-pyrroline-5-carboxylate dehydrogenase